MEFQEFIKKYASHPHYRAPRGNKLNTKSWQTEAPLRMMLNNLDAEVAEDLVQECFLAALDARKRFSARSSERTWMIGNSPKSDIRPALAAGIGAVYVPHDHTWHLEREPVGDGHGRLLTVESFFALRRHF